MNPKVIKLIYATLILTLSFSVIIPVAAYAAGISIDGEFGDWSDKPFLNDTVGDEESFYDITAVKWYVDTIAGTLYLYCERLDGFEDDKGKKFTDWEFYISIDGENQAKRIDVHYHTPSKQVNIEMIDKDGRFLWGARGKWGDDKYSGTRLEFGIPIEYLAGSLPGGYQIDLHLKSRGDMIPDNGNITISTVSTYPSITIIVSVFVVLVGFALYKREVGRKTLSLK